MARLILFSPVRGTVLLNGEPVADAIIEREYRWAWKQETGLDRASSAPDGTFSLPAIERRAFWASWLPHQPHIRQTILITHAGTTHKAWMFDKGDYTLDSELGRPIVIDCHLDRAPSHHGDLFGIATPR